MALMMMPMITNTDLLSSRMFASASRNQKSHVQAIVSITCNGYLHCSDLWTVSFCCDIHTLCYNKTFGLTLFIAFILYRKHHQANILAQNPGLTNPEISKLIGEQWKNTNPEVKKEWKALAEVSV